MKENPCRKKDQQARRPFADWKADVSILPTMNQEEIPSDVLGSYTGTGADGLSPEQDADDL